MLKRCGRGRERKAGLPEEMRDEKGNMKRGKEAEGVWTKGWKVLGVEDEDDPHFDAKFAAQVKAKVQEARRTTYQEVEDPELDASITEDEVEAAVKKLKRGKAAGDDELVAETFKYGGEEMLKALWNMVEKVWQLECVPRAWSRGVIVPLHKKGDKHKPTNYRGITLLSIVTKVLCSVVNARMMKWAEEGKRIVDEQGGFRPRRGCTDQVFALSETIKARMNGGFKTFCCFIDIRKAYDRVSRGGLWLHMWNMGIRGKAWRVIQDMYERVQSCVRVNGRKLEWFDINVGVRQGCVLSPILFSVFFNGLAKAVKDAGLGVPIGRGRKMALLLYADDIVLTARNASDLQKMITVVDEYSRKWRFDMNEDKTEVVVYGGADESGGEGEEYTVRSGKRLKVVHEYRYLGMEVGKGGGWSSFRKRLIARARARLNFAWTLGVHTGHTSVRTAVEIWRTMVCPILDWGAEIWPTDEVNKWAEAEAMQKDVMRRILQCRSKTTTEAVRGELGWWTMKGRRTMLRLRYWGRLVRMDDDRLVKAVYT